MNDRQRWWKILTGSAGGAVAIGVMQWLSVHAAFPLASIPFATSIVLVMGTPDAVPAQPRSLAGGHLISALVGLLALVIAGSEPWVAAAAVGFAMMAMHVTDTFHPPAGINPLIIVLGGMSWSFLLSPVLAGVTMLLGFAWFWNNYVRRTRWPQNWL